MKTALFDLKKISNILYVLLKQMVEFILNINYFILFYIIELLIQLWLGNNYLIEDENGLVWFEKNLKYSIHSPETNYIINLKYKLFYRPNLKKIIELFNKKLLI